MKIYTRIPVVFIAIIVLAANSAFAGGISSHFIEVKMKDLAPGKIYSVEDETGRVLDINNTTEEMTIDIEIEAEAPVDYNLVPGYEPIPDLSWIVIEKNRFEEIGPGESVKTDILVSIPEDEEYAGKKYQVYIYSRTAGNATFRTGIMGRLLLETGDASP